MPIQKTHRTTVQVVVTHEDLALATGGLQDCPVARAVRRLVRPGIQVFVDLGSLTPTTSQRKNQGAHLILANENTLEAYPLPDVARRFLKRFDRVATNVERRAKLRLPTFSIPLVDRVFLWGER